MATCSNCSRKLGCTCQKRVASNGKSCCQACIYDYEKSLRDKKAIKSAPQPLTYNNLKDVVDGNNSEALDNL